MQFSESWLRSLCNPALDSEQLCHLLTMAGLEVEESRPASAEFSQVVVGHILSAERHPDAEKLKVCRVDVGQAEPLQIVCGAPNAAVGMKVPCALVGAKLPGFEIKKAKLRGVESYGMLCSARELGLSDDHGGLLPLAADAVVGTDIRAQLDLEDRLITLKLTPNRADCLSLSGIARELAALTAAPLQLPAITTIPARNEDRRGIRLEAPNACPRYCGRIVRGVNAQAPTPDWMKRRIERSGIRSISALVDITNYVMLELGQPLHAFDNDELEGDVVVRFPRMGETLTLLNGRVITPAPDAALICDEKKPLALAGIMGGEHSGIADSTRDLFLESAFFAPDAIAGKARALGFSSDASHRYERGVDFELAPRAIERATELILAICGGEPGPVVTAEESEHLPARPAVRLRTTKANKALGLALNTEAMRTLLARLGLLVEVNGEELKVTPPSHRFDIAIEEDLIEEIARLHGYDNIPSAPPTAALAMMPQTETQRPPHALRRTLAALGYHETVNYSFIEAQWEADFCANTTPITLANPIASQMSVMRSSLIGGLVGVLQGNLRRQIAQVRVFELGRCFLRTEQSGEYRQPLRVAGLAGGLAQPEQWGVADRAIDFYDVKADVEALLRLHRADFKPLTHPALHPGRAAQVMVDGVAVGLIGELHPQWVQKYELGKAPVVFELDLEVVLGCPFPAFATISKFPAVTRDLALVVPEQQTFEPLRAALQGAAPGLVKSVELFDVYRGKGLNENQKSLAFHIVMQDTERTLEEADIESTMSRLLDCAERDFGAQLRR